MTHTHPSGDSGFEVVCLDMAGTTVSDDGTVMTAFTTALRAVGVAEGSPTWRAAMDTVAATMGQSKLDVFREVVGGTRARSANTAFEQAYAGEVQDGRVTAMPGVAELLGSLREQGVRSCLLTGFSPATRDVVIDRLGWSDLVDLVLSPADAGRGRPWPDLVLAAALRLEAGAMSAVAVVGDTRSDVLCGRRAGAGLVVGVTSGAGSADELSAAGAHHVLGGVAELAPLLIGDRAGTSVR